MRSEIAMCLVLGDSRKNVQREAGCVRVVGGDERNVAVHERAQEAYLPAQAVKLGNEQRCSCKAAALNRSP